MGVAVFISRCNAIIEDEQLFTGCFPVKAERITDDACNDSTFLFGPNRLSVEKYRAENCRIRNLLRGCYDRIFICHHAVDTSADMLDNMIDACDGILSGHADDLPFEFMGMRAWIARKCSPRFERADGKHGNLIYGKDRVSVQPGPLKRRKDGNRKRDCSWGSPFSR